MKLTYVSIGMFLNRIRKPSDDPNECWKWIGRLDVRGYAAFDYERKTYLAHRFSYLYHNGEFNERMFICHECDNRQCTNPKHLFVGTHQDNQKDKIEKYRHTYGVNQPFAKANPDIVRAIRKMSREEHYTTRQLAEMFGLNHCTIWNIVAGKTWKQVKDD